MVNLDESDGQNGSGGGAIRVVTYHQESTKQRGALMNEAQREDALRTLEQSFGGRLKQGPARGKRPVTEGALASVLPMNAEEVRLLAEVAERFSTPLVALGGEMATDAVEKGSILVRFDLMRRTRLPDGEEPWAEAEPGVLWLQLDNELRMMGRGLAVYPTSAPRATVGGWLAMDGLGVGSFEYGWLRENVLSASVVLGSGELVEMAGEEVRSFVGPGARGIIVGAKLRTRRAEADVPFGVAFGSAAEMVGAVAGVIEAGLPLWHLAFLNPGMAHARNLGENFLLFGAYPAEREGEIEGTFRSAVASSGGRVLLAAEAHRAWGERFFPVTPSVVPPRFTVLSRELVPLVDLAGKLSGVEGRPGHHVIQGSVGRSGEVLLLKLEDHQEGSAW
jgi:FAD/FMN-containing dehydrogenase